MIVEFSGTYEENKKEITKALKAFYSSCKSDADKYCFSKDLYEIVRKFELLTERNNEIAVTIRQRDQLIIELNL